MKSKSCVALLYLFFFTDMSVFGQLHVNDSNTLFKFEEATNAILANQGRVGSNKTNLTTQRLLFNTSYQILGGNQYLIDSLQSMYYTDGGSYFNLNSMSYDYANNVTRTFTNQLSYNSCAVMADSTAYYKKPTQTSAVTFIGSFQNRFNVENNLSSYYEAFTYRKEDARKYIFSYDVKGRVNESANYIWDNGAASLQLQTIRKSTYDIDDKVLSDTVYDKSGVAGAVYSYSYDASGNLSSIVSGGIFNGKAFYDQGMAYTYDANNRLIAADWISNMYTGTYLAIIARDSFTYSGSSQFYLTKESKWSQGLGGGWYPSTFTTKHLNSSGLPDSVYYWNEMGSIVNYLVFDYNSYGNPTKQQGYVGSPGNAVNPAIIRYYTYEIYTTVVQDEFNQEINLYPNPTYDDVILSGLNLSTDLTFTVINSTGMHMNCLTRNCDNGVLLETQTLPPGTYWITVGKKGLKPFKTKAFIKQ
jgi:hypothetical protein